MTRMFLCYNKNDFESMSENNVLKLIRKKIFKHSQKKILLIVTVINTEIPCKGGSFSKFTLFITFEQ